MGAFEGLHDCFAHCGVKQGNDLPCDSVAVNNPDGLRTLAAELADSNAASAMTFRFTIHNSQKKRASPSEAPT